MKVLHIIPTIRRADGGIGQAAMELADHLAGAGVETWVLTAGAELQQEELFLPKNASVRMLFASISNTYGFKSAFGHEFRRALRGFAWRGCIVHVHGLWIHEVCDAQRFAAEHGCPVALSPHGMLTRWALRRAAAKKILAWAWFQASALQSINVIVASSTEEACIPNRILSVAPARVIPFGIARRQRDASLQSRRRKIVLFIGRLHPVKGLENLLRAWARVAHHGWQLLLAGPEFADYGVQLKRLAHDLKIDDSVNFMGPLYGNAKEDILQDSSLFVMPSYSENFSLATAEALQAGVPVIVSTNCPWSVVAEERCGWWVPNSIESLESTLRMALSLPADCLRQMGERGAELVRREFEWERVIDQYRRLYGSLMSSSAPLNNVT